MTPSPRWTKAYSGFRAVNASLRLRMIRWIVCGHEVAKSNQYNQGCPGPGGELQVLCGNAGYGSFHAGDILIEMSSVKGRLRC